MSQKQPSEDLLLQGGRKPVVFPRKRRRTPVHVCFHGTTQPPRQLGGCHRLGCDCAHTGQPVMTESCHSALPPLGCRIKSNSARSGGGVALDAARLCFVHRICRFIGHFYFWRAVSPPGSGLRISRRLWAPPWRKTAHCSVQNDFISLRRWLPCPHLAVAILGCFATNPPSFPKMFVSEPLIKNPFLEIAFQCP